MSELISYLPPLFADIKEFREICRTEDAEISALKSELGRIEKDCFVETMTERGCAHWERMMKITPKATDTLAFRGFRILSKLNEQLPYTYYGLVQQLTALCGQGGFDIEVDYDGYAINVAVSLSEKARFNEVFELLKRVVPANMIIALTLMYNTHRLVASRTHGQLAARTHSGIRQEVLN